jgi:hypothetical protein
MTSHRAAAALTAAAIVALGLAGCARSVGSTAPRTTSAAGPYRASSLKAITPGPNESRRLASLAPLLKKWADAETKAGRVPADLTGITPTLVGYRVQIWSTQADGRFTLGSFQVTDGRVDQLGNPGVALKAKNVALLQDQPSHPDEGVTPASAGEKDAVAKASAWAKAAFPGRTWHAEIQGYEFYYALKADGYFLFIPNAASTGYMAVGGTSPK